ncbi:hypothetical protein ACI6LE_004117 [Cronobacter sakazakii]|nr:hypothetical protein [Salmonella enterica]
MHLIKKSLVIISVLLVASCTHQKSKDKLVNDYLDEGMDIQEAMSAYKKQYHTDLLTYIPSSGYQQDDSQWITQDNLNYVASMIQCPPSKNAYSISKEAVIKSDGVHVIVNRSDCSIDNNQVKNYLDHAIHVNQIEHGKRVASEIERKATSPVGPFVMGCEDYQRTFKGQEIYTVDYAIKQYNKINTTYVINLYNMGFDTAKYHGINADCNYLAAIQGIR